jgi:hypothetical protein
MGGEQWFLVQVSYRAKNMTYVNRFNYSSEAEVGYGDD